MTLKCSEFINVLCVCAFQMYRVNCVNHRGKLWIATCWIAHVCVHAQVHDHTDQNKALVACFTGESISIFIDQNSGYYFALTWKSISQLGCTASLDFYDWSRDRHNQGIQWSHNFSLFYMAWTFLREREAKILLPHAPHPWKVWFMGPFCTGRNSL